MQEGGQWQNGVCSKEFTYFANDRICLGDSEELVWDGVQCVNRSNKPNFYRHCKESVDIEIRKFVDAIRLFFGEKTCEGAYTKLKTSKILRLEFLMLTNVEPLINMNHIEILSLKGNKISDLSFLISMTSLKSLNLDDNNISDISDLANLRNLEYISLKNNPVFDLSALRDLENLKKIEVEKRGPAKISDKYTCPKNGKSPVLSEFCMQLEQ